MADPNPSVGLVAALDYAERFPVFPVALIRDGDNLKKKPLVKWGNEASRDPEIIRSWWQQWPNAAPATPTGAPSGLIVLDIDTKGDGPNGFDTLDDLGKSLPATPISHTPHHGVHVFFAVNPAVEIRNSVGTDGLGRGLDVRGQGGMIMLPDGRDGGYWWDPHYDIYSTPLLPAPAWLGHKKPRPPAQPGTKFDPQAILTAACANIRTAQNGRRHEIINREVFGVAGLVASGALAEHDAKHQLAAAVLSMTRFSSGDLKKAEADFSDAWRDGLAKSRRPIREARR